MLKKLESFKLPELEKKVLEFWKTDDTFAKSLKKTKKGKPFVFFEGPPTANGRPGIHHVLSRAFKDIVLRYKTMRGFYVPRRAGWDTHGLPVEIEVEKSLGIKNKAEIEKFGIAEFNEQARQSVWKYKREWENLTHRMGFWLDTEHPYVTYENSYIESLWYVFKKIHDRGLLKKFYKIVPYCPRCQTSLSSHELAQPGAYKKTKDPSLYVKFQISNPKSQTKEFLLVWTTTPWTLPANVAVAVNPTLTYTKFKIGDEYLWSHNPPPERGGQKAEVVEKISGKKLVGLKYRPLFKLPTSYQLQTTSYYKVLAADFVSVEDGTGLVHIAPAFGEDDLNLIKKEFPKIEQRDIPVTIDGQGKVMHGFPGAGEFIKKADQKVSADLAGRGLLYYETVIEHDYPFCWRCSAPLIYFARDSWFVEMSRLRKELVSANKKINWIPEHIREGRFGEWLTDVKDWAISRERYWGTPLPIWECEKCGKHLVIGGRDDMDKHAYRKNKFFLLRHTEATHILQGYIASGKEQGKHISELTEKGVRDAGKIAKLLKKKKIDMIFSSPYKRAKEMAGIISKAVGAPVVFDERLSEINTGVFNWRPVFEYHKFFDKPTEKFVKNPPGGENLIEVKKRVFGFAKDIDGRNLKKNILVVGHGYPLWMLHAALADLSNEEAIRVGDPELGELRELKLNNSPRDKNSLSDMHRPYVDDIELECSACHGRMLRIKEVADVWFDSGAMPFAQWHYPFENKNLIDGQPRRSTKKEVVAPTVASAFPANYIVEGIDQTRGWFYTLLAVSLLMRKGLPYHNCIALGLVLDKSGQKMSKSKGNVVDPWAMFDQYGADVLRWYFYTVNAPGDPKRFDEADLKKISNKVFSILYNSFVFFDTYADKKSKIGNWKLEIGNLTNVLDRWVLARLHETIANTTLKLEAYEIGEAARHIEEFIDDVSHWYIRRSRRRLQKQPRRSDNGSEVGAPTPEGVGGGAGDYEDYLRASQTLRYVLESMSMLIAPFAPFFGDALYRTLVQGGSVHLADWPKGEKKYVDKKLISGMKEVRVVASQALALRASLGIKVRQPLQELRIKKQELSKETELLEILKDEVNVKHIKFDKALKDDLELDTHITAELHIEGVLREIARAIQGLRQDAGLEPKDRIQVFFKASDPTLESIVSEREETLNKAVGSTGISLRKFDKVLVELETRLDNASVWIGIKK